MTEETRMIWEQMRIRKTATLGEILSWTGRDGSQSIVTVRLMVRAGQLVRGPHRVKPIYSIGQYSTFGLVPP